MKSITLKSMSALALALVAGGVMTTTAAADSFEKNSSSNIEYLSGKIDIVDPENPDPSNPDNDKLYPAVPTFDFGQQQITSLDQTYDNKNAGALKITDLRGTNEGWKVTVKQTAQLKSKDTAQELSGAVLKLNHATGTTDTGSVNFTAQDLTAMNTEALIFKAEKDNGNGASKLEFAAGSDAQLEVPGGTAKVKEAYTAELVWTVTDSPA